MWPVIPFKLRVAHSVTHWGWRDFVLHSHGFSFVQMRQFCYCFPAINVPHHWTRCKKDFVSDFWDAHQMSWQNKHVYVYRVLVNVWCICNLYKNSRISSVTIRYTLKDDTPSSCTKYLTLVQGVASIMFPTILTFSKVCYFLAPTLPHSPSSKPPMCSNLDTRR